VKLKPSLLRISPGVIAIYAVVSTIAVPLALATPQLNGVDFLLQLVIGLVITTIAIIALLSLLAVKLLPEQIQLPAWLAGLIIIGAGRGYLLATAAARFEFIDPAPLSVRMLNSIVTTLLWVTLSAVFIELARNFRSSYQKQISVLFLRQAAAQAELNKDFSLLTSKTTQLQQIIEDLQAAKPANLTTSSKYQHLIEQVRNQVNDVLRPISHRLYSSDVLIAPKIRPLRALRLSISQLSFSIPTVLTLLVFTGFINGLAIFGFAISLLRLVLVVAVWLLIHLLWHQTKFAQQVNSSARNISYLVVAGIGPIMFSEAINDVLNLDHNYFVAVLLSPLLPTLIVLTSLIEFFQQERDQIIDRLTQIGQQTSEQLDPTTLDRKQLATYLHNSLQSELVGISMQLAAASSAADEAAAKAAMERLHATLTRSIQTGFQQLKDSPADRLTQVTSSWIGIADISLQLADFDQLVLADQTNLVQLCEELISNSVRLGGASQIQLAGELTAAGYELTLTSNGQFGADYAAGLGSSWILEITGGQWQIAATDTGVIATAKLKLAVN
jgi:signal transduction histidine kinase